MFLPMFTKSRGFTLIEILAALAIFSIVAVIAAGATVAINSVSQKSQAIKLALDNLNFALESMALNITRGAQYECLNNPPTSYASMTITGTNCLGLALSVFADPSNPSVSTRRAYWLNNGQVFYSKDLSSSLAGSAITSADLRVSDLSFDSLTYWPFGATSAYVRIAVSGVAAAGSRYQTDFSIETYVGARGVGFN